MRKNVGRFLMRLNLVVGHDRTSDIKSKTLSSIQGLS